MQAAPTCSKTARSNDVTGPDGAACTGACEGLGAAGDRLVLNRRLHEVHAAAAAKLRSGERLLHAPTLAFSDAAVDRVLAEGRAAGTDLRVVIEAEALAPIAALSGEPAAFVYLRGDTEGEPTARAAGAPTRVLQVKQTLLPGFDLPDAPFQVVDEWALPVSHWAQLLWANLLALGPALWQALGSGVAGALRVAWGMACAGSVAPYRVARHVNVVGRGARIHPNATLEGCVVGAGATVGAGAVVRGCVIGEGARVEDLALVEGSVLGPGACVQRLAMVKYSVVEARAFVAGIQQLAMIGEGATTKHGAILMDQSFGGPVRVRVGAELKLAPHGMLGVCLGPGAVVGSGVNVAAGRAIPAGLTIVQDPADLVLRLDLPAGTSRARVFQGGLQPL